MSLDVCAMPDREHNKTTRVIGIIFFIISYRLNGVNMLKGRQDRRHLLNMQNPICYFIEIGCAGPVFDFSFKM